MNKTIIIFFHTLLLFSLLSTNAQTQKEEISLSIVLDAIHKKFGYNFSYVDKDIKKIKVLMPPGSLGFKETISYLEKTTPFIYTILNDRTVALSFKSTFIEICGILTDKNQKIISNATIQSLSDSTISNSTGEFRININMIGGTVSINHIGYESLTIKVNDFEKEKCKQITLNPKIEYLNEILLKNYLVKGIDKQIDGSISINYNDFGSLPGVLEPDLLQTIQALPGISSVNETISDINVRGGTNDQNLILWDGIKIYQSSHFFGLISAFNPYLTKNVKLFKNGSSATYGDGVSSVIDMKTSDSLKTKTDASIGVNLISFDGYVDTRISKKSSLQFAIRHSINEIVKTTTYNKYFDKTFQNSEVIDNQNSDNKFSFYDTNIRWLYKLSPKDLIKANLLIMHNDLKFQENSVNTLQNTSKESSLEQNNIAGGFFHQRNWTANFQSKLLFYGTNYNLRSINSDIENNQRLLQENDVLENGIKLSTHYKSNFNFNIENGYQFNETGISNLQDLNNPTFRNRIKEVLRTHSVFSELEYKSRAGKDHLHFGLRLNYFEKFKKYTLEPRISFQKQFAHYFTLEVLGELKSQTTSQIIDFQNDFLGVENRRWILSNDQDIPIVKSVQGSIGINYKNHNWLINADVYYKDVKGIITRSQGFQNQFEFARDHGSYEVKGIDFLINKRFRKISTWFSYSYANNQYTFLNLSETNFPNNIDINHHIKIAASYTIKNLKLSGGMNWHSGKPITEPIYSTPISNDTINYQNANSSRATDYLRIDFSTTYKFRVTKKINALVGVSIWNIFNHENISNKYYKTVEENSITEINQFGLATSPNIVFRLYF